MSASEIYCLVTTGSVFGFEMKINIAVIVFQTANNPINVANCPFAEPWISSLHVIIDSKMIDAQKSRDRAFAKRFFSNAAMRSIQIIIVNMEIAKTSSRTTASLFIILSAIMRTTQTQYRTVELMPDHLMILSISLPNVEISGCEPTDLD
jgi:hypothetical protein